jgi:excisionase family DNA binding protein
MKAAPSRGYSSGELHMPRKIVRPQEAAQRLGIKHTKFYELVNAGRLQLVRLGPRCTGVVEDELDALIDQLVVERDAALRASRKPTATA